MKSLDGYAVGIHGLPPCISALFLSSRSSISASVGPRAINMSTCFHFASSFAFFGANYY